MPTSRRNTSSGRQRRAMGGSSGRAGGPQFSIGGGRSGGSDELARLYAGGALDRLGDTENSPAE